MENTKSLLSQITGDGFTHIRRTTNEVAHCIARFASHIGSTTTWFEEPLDLIIHALYEDCNK